MRATSAISLATSGLMIAVAILALAGCEAKKPAAEVVEPETTIAPAPAAHPEPDANAAPVERASPPMLKPVALGTFEPGNPVAEAITGKLEVEDD